MSGLVLVPPGWGPVSFPSLSFSIYERGGVNIFSEHLSPWEDRLIYQM